jgi:hypothetical protein
MAKYILGIKRVKHGEVAADGGYPKTYDKQLQPYKDSVTFEDADGEVVQHFYQGARYPFLTIYAASGTELKFSVPMDNDNLVQWMGGSIEEGEWQAPRGNYQVSQALELMTEFDIPITIPRATCYGIRRFGSKTTDVSLIEIHAVIELPSMAEVSPMVIGVQGGSDK